MKIGLYFGSFNPIHNGHLIIAEHLNNFYTEKIWFVISPQNPFKNKIELLDAYKRLHLIKESIKNNQRFEACDIELHLSKPTYTANTLKILTDDYPQHNFFLIIGSDNFLKITDWKSSDFILQKFKIFVYERPGFIIEERNQNQNIIIIKAPLINISSTEIRNLIKEKKSIRYLVPEVVLSEINNNKFYN